MIYRDGEKIPNSEFAKFLEITKKQFPKFFNKTNPRTVTLGYTSDKFFSYRDDKGNVVTTKAEMTPIVPNNTLEAADGQTHEYRYVERIGNDSRGEKDMYPRTIELSDRHSLVPGKDNELLVYIWNFSGQIVNNACPDRHKNNVQVYVIEMPEKEAAEEMEIQGRMIDAQALVIGRGAMSPEKQLSVAKALLIPFVDEMSTDEVSKALIGYLKVNASSLSQFERVAEMGDEYDIRRLVNDSMEAGILVFDPERNAYCISTPDGKPGKEFFRCRGYTDVDRLKELINTIAASKSHREELANYLDLHDKRSSKQAGTELDAEIKSSRDFACNPAGLKKMREYLDGRTPLAISAFFQAEINGGDSRPQVVALAEKFAEPA